MPKPTGVPGTVSKILWHFTGGPKWDAEKNAQEDHPKPTEEARNALVGILQSRELRVGNYREVVTVRIPKRKFIRATKTWKRIGHRDIVRESAPVCCVADIPIAHLSYHAERYGKFALGFHRDAICHKFNPVFYSLRESPALRLLHQGFAELDSLKHVPKGLAESVSSKMQALTCDEGHAISLSNDDEEEADVLEYIGIVADIINDDLGNIEGAFRQFLAFIKTFRRDQFSTIYCEREWRATATFSFTFEDVAMIVVPKSGDDAAYGRFVEEIVDEVNLPRAVPVVSWEDLVEH